MRHYDFLIPLFTTGLAWAYICIFQRCSILVYDLWSPLQPFYAYTRVDGYPRTVGIIMYVRGTAAAILYMCVGDIMVMIYNPVHTAVSIITDKVPTKVYLGAT